MQLKFYYCPFGFASAYTSQQARDLFEELRPRSQSPNYPVLCFNEDEPRAVPANINVESK